MRLRITLLAVSLVAVCAAGLAAPASASELIDRNASNVRLAVNPKGQALLTYQARGRTWRVLAWGAVNAIAPTQSRPQVKFPARLLRRLGHIQARGLEDVQEQLRSLQGPRPEVARDSLHCSRRLALGEAPTPPARASASGRSSSAVAHWTGEPPEHALPALDGPARDHTELGLPPVRPHVRTLHLPRHPVHGFRSTSSGVPLDTFGRNLYVDTFNSTYGPGWRRENSFLMHKGSGAFCYGFRPTQGRP